MVDIIETYHEFEIFNDNFFFIVFSKILQLYSVWKILKQCRYVCIINILNVMYGACTACNVISIQRDRNCLFCSVSYGMHNTEDRYSEIRLSTVNKNII